MIEHLEVEGIRVYARMDRGNLACMVRVTDRETFDAQALAVGLKVYTYPAQDEVLDEEGAVIVPAVPASGPLVTAPYVTITELGPMILTPAVLSEEGDVITPPVIDSRHHVNFWLGPELVARGQWQGWTLMWSIQGKDTVGNNVEEGVSLMGIELIDPQTVSSPSNVLL